MTCTNYLLDDVDDVTIGIVLVAPSGRRVIVRRVLSGTSKKDCFSRILCQYEGGGPKDLVTLQPHLLRLTEMAPML